ncbi:ATP-binding protein [Aerococcaceae bacterium WGS1372]
MKKFKKKQEKIEQASKVNQTSRPGHYHHWHPHGHSHRHPIAKKKLMILFSIIVFIILSITMLIVGLITVILVHSGVILSHFQAPSIFYPILIFAVVSIVTGTVVAAIFSAIPLRPVNILINGMNRLAFGEYDTRINLGNSKIGVDLAYSFNQLAKELSNTEMLRSDFVNNFSHEFKTPIVSIRGFAKLLQKGNLSEDKQAEYLNIIVEEVSRLADLSTNALNLTKIENQTILTDITSFNLSEQLRNSILLLEHKWVKKDIVFLPEFGEHMIEANEELLKQIWINLVDNSIKFAPESSRITLTIQEDSEFLTVCIQNVGPRISDADLKRIFNKYWQADSSHATEGAGIGLSIAKRVVDLHNGYIGVDSTDERTIFIVQLPKNSYREV